MTPEVLVAVVMLAALVAYAVLGGADFGGGIWDLLSYGPRAEAQRRKIAEAIGPVWEANHVWLIFVVVLLFTCFPRAYAAVSIALFWPLHLALVGIVLRGAAFVFRAYGSSTVAAQVAWGRMFGAASALTPLVFGACLGAISAGRIRVDAAAGPGGHSAWLAPFPLMTGILAFLLCAYLAAVYLAWETTGALREDFRRLALVTWLVAGMVSLATLALTRNEAPRLWEALTSARAGWVVLAGVLLAPASALALWRGRVREARVLGAGQVTLLLVGWALAQWPYLVYPDLTLTNAAAPRATLLAAASTLPLGFGLLIPSIWLLFRVFKGHHST